MIMALNGPFRVRTNARIYFKCFSHISPLSVAREQVTRIRSVALFFACLKSGESFFLGQVSFFRSRCGVRILVIASRDLVAA